MWPQWKLLNQQKFFLSLRTEDEQKRQRQWWRFHPFFAALVFFPSYIFDNDYYDDITDSKRHSSLDFYVESTSSGEIDRQRYFYMVFLSVVLLIECSLHSIVISSSFLQCEKQSILFFYSSVQHSMRNYGVLNGWKMSKRQVSEAAALVLDGNWNIFIIEKDFLFQAKLQSLQTVCSREITVRKLWKACISIKGIKANSDYKLIFRRLAEKKV